MIIRNIDNLIKNYYHSTKKALLLTGARQTGKTFAIRKLGENFENFAEINFVNNPSAIGLLNHAEGVDELILTISAITGKRLKPGKTLIFFDEVQKCPEIVTAIKFLVEDGRFRYALSGSLLGVELKDLRSEPVGSMDIMELYPLTFVEFSAALGMPENVLDAVRAAWQQRKPLPDLVHKKMMTLFRLYLIVGGMPAVVQRYMDTNNLTDVRNEQLAILRLYKRDIAQYDPEEKLYLNEIFDLIPSELNAKNKRFILKTTNKHAKFERLSDDFLWLKNAGVALPVFNVEEPKYPLLLAKCRNLFKLFQNDVGLLAAQYAKNLQPEILKEDSTINYGAIYENVVAQMLQAQGFPLYYFNSKKQGEVDFLIEMPNGVPLPIEVKSGKDYHRHQALSHLLSHHDYHIDEAVVLYNNNLEQKGNILYAPVYMPAFMQEPDTEDFIYKVDLNEKL